MQNPQRKLFAIGDAEDKGVDLEKGEMVRNNLNFFELSILRHIFEETGGSGIRSIGVKGEYFVVFDYMEEEAGVYAAKAAFKLAEALIKGEQYTLDEDVQRLREIREDTRLGSSTGSIVDEAVKRGIPYIRLNRQSLVQLGYGIHQKRICATIASTTSSIAVDIAGDKEETKNLLSAAEIPVPKGIIVYRDDTIDYAIKSIGFPFVIKPIDSNHGKGATTNINTMEQVEKALEAARRFSKNVICEKYITGFDFRVLVIGYKFICAALRTPACVTGDGEHTIQWLVDEVNNDSRRGFGHEKVLI